MCGLAMLIHRADFAQKKKLRTRRERVNIWRGEHSNTAGREQVTNIAQEIDGTFDMLDNFNGGHEAKRSVPHLPCKIPRIKIQAHLREPRLKPCPIPIAPQTILSASPHPGSPRTGRRGRV